MREDSCSGKASCTKDWGAEAVDSAIWGTVGSSSGGVNGSVAGSIGISEAVCSAPCSGGIAAEGGAMLESELCAIAPKVCCEVWPGSWLAILPSSASTSKGRNVQRTASPAGAEASSACWGSKRGPAASSITSCSVSLLGRATRIVLTSPL